MPGQPPKAAVSALQNLVGVVEAGDARIAQAESILRRGGVAAQGWDGTRPEGYDEMNHANMQQGGTASSVIVDGNAYTPDFASLRIAAAVREVAGAHGGPPLPNGAGALGARMSFDRPRALRVEM